MATTRSHPRFRLLGNSSGSLSMSRLPTSKDALLMVQHFHINEAQTITVSLNKACLKVKEVWDHAHIPTQRVDSCARKLSKLYHQYQMLKVNRNRQRESDIMKEQVFQADIEKLFDIATKDAMMTMVNLEDKKFLTMQRESVQSCSMASIDKELASLETRRQQRKEKESMAKARYEAREEFNKTGQAFHYDPSSSSSSSEEEYQPSAPIPSSSGAPPLKRSRKTDIIKSPVVIEAMDRTNLSDRNAVFVAGAVAQALGHDIADMSFSRSTIRRFPSCVMAFNGQEKLLGVPKKREKLEAQAEASCRHHVLEIMLSDVFSLICGSTGSPETILFKRFKKQWRSISLNDFIPAPESMFEDPMLQILRKELLEYLPVALQDNQPRDDYREFLELALCFLVDCQ
ncbi:uncharacterized protein LOC121866302, partial [Homarus americanus]|uniref:uncharacterized protein LOC121866302 n=1 Tax=Homarus americanus TaxID=6706 RepID=UPI001C469E89